jgi:YVTN family beta-propeller protein
MNSRALALVVCVVAVVSGQVIEKTIQLPDSFGVLVTPDCIVHNPVSNTVVVGSRRDDAVIMIDCATRQKLARVPVPGGVQDICVNTRDNKVYAVSDCTDSLVVIDSLHRRLHAVALGYRVHELCYNPTANKLYCTADTWGDSLTIVDCAADTVLGRVRAAAGYSYRSVACCNPAGNKVYCSDFDDVVIIDGAGDTALRRVPWVLHQATDIEYCPASEKVYCASYYAGVSVLDAAADTLLRRRPSVPGMPAQLCVNPVENKVYVAGDEWSPGWAAVVSGTGDTTLAIVGLTAIPRALVYDPLNHRAYCGTDMRRLFAICGRGDTLVDSVALADVPADVCADSSGIVYVANMEVTAVDGGSMDVVARVPLTFSPAASIRILQNGKVYFASRFERGLVVVDAATRRVTGSIPLPIQPGVMEQAWAKFYCAGGSADGPRLVALDYDGDSILATVDIGPEPSALCYVIWCLKLYCASAAAAELVVVDCTGDSVLARIRVGAYPVALCYALSHGKLYAANWAGRSVSVIAPGADSVTATVPVGLAPGAFAYVAERSAVCCANRGDNTVSVIDIPGDSVVATLPVGDAPVAMVYNYWADKLYCANSRSDDVTVIDALSWRVLRTIPVGNSPVGLELSEQTELVYVACGDGDEVTVISSPDDRVVGRLRVGDSPGPMTWLAGRVFVGNRLGASLTVVRDSLAPGIEEAMDGERGARGPGPTIVRGVLMLPRDMTEFGPANSDRVPRPVLLDAAGRRVLALKPGANDVRSLPAGVYFVHSTLDTLQSKMTKVVIQK